MELKAWSLPVPAEHWRLEVKFTPAKKMRMQQAILRNRAVKDGCDAESEEVGEDSFTGLSPMMQKFGEQEAGFTRNGRTRNPIQARSR